MDDRWAGEHWMRKVGDIDLLAQHFMCSSALETEFGLSPEDWQWAQYQANRYLRGGKTWEKLEPRVLKELLSAGRAYAIRRYARREHLSPEAAMTATLPYGMTALLHRYFSEEGIPLSHAHRQKLRLTLSQGLYAKDSTAYDKTACIQADIHTIATDLWGNGGPLRLDRNRTRKILSLSRLHFSVAETKSKSYSELAQLEKMYETRRQHSSATVPTLARRSARFIRDWQLQHLWPLSYYYPVPIRQALKRGQRHLETEGQTVSRTIMVNEVALIYCVMQAARERHSARCVRVPTDYRKVEPRFPF